VVKPAYFERGLNSFFGRSPAGAGALRPARVRRLAARAARQALA
jgi:hypothetical protein